MMNLRPLVIPQETPEQTLMRIFKSVNYENSVDFKIIIEHLGSYQKAGNNGRWDDYVNKIPDVLRKTWGLILAECARNGFIAPYVYDGKLIFRQVVTRGKQADLCTLCRRECLKRENTDSGEYKWRIENVNGFREPKKCWEGAKQ